MTFTLDRTRSYLRVSEPNLISLLRSTASVVPPDFCGCGRPCQAFICAAREYNLFRVFISLYDPQFKSNLVFTADPIEPQQGKLAALQDEAVAFVGAMGFEMAEVSVSFSSATREVVMKNCHVFREPSPELQLQAAMAAVDQLTAEKNELVRKIALSNQELMEENASLKAQLQAEPEGVAPAGPAVEEQSLASDRLTLSTLEQEIGELQQELSQAKADLQSAHKSAKAARARAKSAQEALKQANSDLDLRRSQVEELQVQLLRAETSATEHQDRVLTLQAELEATRAAAMHDRTEAQEAVTLKERVETLTRQVEESKTEAACEIEALRATLQVSEENLRAERAKNESALQEMDALESNAGLELKKLKKTVDSLTNEKRLLESMAAEFRLKSRDEIERLKKENQSQRRAAIKKVAALKEEMRLLAEARVEIATPFGPFAMSAPAAPPPLHQIENPVRDHSVPGPLSAPSPFDACSNGYTTFDPVPSLAGIPYAASTHVLELYRSINRIQAAPAGGAMQTCDGYTCLVQEGEQRAVYVAWLMSDTNEVLVCRPDALCRSDEEARMMVQEGLGYFERIGLLMDRVELVPDQGRRQVQLDDLSVFHHLDIEEAAA